MSIFQKCLEEIEVTVLVHHVSRGGFLPTLDMYKGITLKKFDRRSEDAEVFHGFKSDRAASWTGYFGWEVWRFQDVPGYPHAHVQSLWIKQALLWNYMYEATGALYS